MEKIFSVKPQLKTLEAAFILVETKYRLVKKQHETVLDRLVDEGTGPEDKLVLATKTTGDKTKADFLQIPLKFAVYRKEQNSPENSKHATTLKALTLSMSSTTSAVHKVADNIGQNRQTQVYKDYKYQYGTELAEPMLLGKRSSAIG